MNKYCCIIDDDPIYRFSFAQILGMIDPSLQTLSFENGQEAWDNFKGLIEKYGEAPSFIFLDLNMPVMDGWNFLDELSAIDQSAYFETQLYIVSSSVHEKDLERAKDYSLVSDYLVKPIKRTRLVEILEST